jgi:hypothetical protein
MANNSRGGPKTAHGKKHSSRNARRHGLFAVEFSFSTEDEAKFTKLSSGLRKDLKPEGALLDFLFSDLVACAWRIPVALRYEQQELAKQFAMENKESREELEGSELSFRCNLKARKLEQALKLLDDLKASIEQQGRLPSEFEKEVTLTFGADLWKTLKEWAPVDGVSFWAYRLSQVVAERCEVYGLEHETIAKATPKEEKKYFEANAVKEIEYISKIIDIYRDIWTNIQHQAEHRSGMLFDESQSRLDLSLRYATTARRDFYRSLREYREAENPG